MMQWPLQDSKNRFGELGNAALDGEPEQVTLRGQPAVVVLAVEEHDRLRRLERAQAPSLAELLLDIPQDDQKFELHREVD